MQAPLTSETLWTDIKSRAERAGKIRREISETATGTRAWCSTLISDKQWRFLNSLCSRENNFNPSAPDVLGLEDGMFTGRLLKCGAVQVRWNEFTHEKIGR